MNLLAIDTSTKNLSLAVAKDGKVARARNKELLKPLSSSIMPSIKDILKSAGLTLSDLDGYAVGLGPGSFTSLRVGVSTVKGLAFATGKPVVGISSLDVLALNVDETEAQVCTLCDAKRALVYACLYEKKGNTLKKMIDYSLKKVDDILCQVKGKAVFVGDGVPIFKNKIKKAKGVTPVYPNGNSVQPQAKHLITLAMSRFETSKADDINRLVPLYLYPEHCQIRE